MWCPESVHQADDIGILPLHLVALKEGRSIEPFRCVFNASMRYFPPKIGFNIRFKKGIDGTTPFRLRVKYLYPVQKDIDGEQQRRNELVDLIDTTLEH